MVRSLKPFIKSYIKQKTPKRGCKSFRRNFVFRIIKNGQNDYQNRIATRFDIRKDNYFLLNYKFICSKNL